MVLEIPTEVFCPYCGEPFTTFIDTSVVSQQYTEDCQICCRPIVFEVQTKFGEVLHCSLRPETG
jgi:hypothetical protein